MHYRITFFAIVTLFFTGACSKNECSNSVKAEIADASNLGCGRILKLSDNSYLEPKNLDDFSIDQTLGNKVWVTYTKVTTGGTVCMIGDVVEIECIVER